MEIYNIFTDNDGYCNAYITCGSTGNASVAIDGATIHTPLKITQGTLHPFIHIAFQVCKSSYYRWMQYDQCWNAVIYWLQVVAANL